MKHKFFILMVIIMISGAFLIGCNEQQKSDDTENIKQANKELNNAQVQYKNEWQQFKKDIELAISNNEKRIKGFQVQFSTTSKEFKAKYENKILTLEQKNIELKKKLNEYKYEGKENWEEFKGGFLKDINNLDAELNDLFAVKD